MKLGNEVIALYLYGSRNTDDYTPLSDLDIAVLIINGEMLSLESEKAIFKYLTNEYGISMDKIDLKILQDLPIGNKYEVILNGKILYLADNERQEDIEIAIIKEYLDIAPLFKKYHELYKESFQEEVKTWD